jgi:hypothetical protein
MLQKSKLPCFQIQRSKKEVEWGKRGKLALKRALVFPARKDFSLSNKEIGFLLHN